MRQTKDDRIDALAFGRIKGGGRLRSLVAALAVVLAGWCVFDVLIRTALGPLLVCSHGDTPQAYGVGLVFGVLVCEVKGRWVK